MEDEVQVSNEETKGKKNVSQLGIVGIVFLTLFVVFVVIIILALIIGASKRSILTNSFLKSKPVSPNLKDPSWSSILKNGLFFDRYVQTHAHSFLIDDDGKLWYKIVSQQGISFQGTKPVSSSSSTLSKSNSTNLNEIDFVKQGWKALFWENFYNRKVDKLMADGADLMLWDDKGYVHYRKVLKDKRSGKEDEFYEFVDKIEKTNYWYPGWSMTLVILDHLSSRIQVPKNNQVAMAHRGFWNSFVQDVRTGKKYPEVKIVGGNTSLFRCDGEFIYLADALAPGKYIKKFPVPEKLERFRLCGSASVVCLIGYHSQSGCWKGWWKLIDLDTLGFMPHVNFYTKVGTEWISVSPIPSSDKTLNLNGCVLLNRGDNQRELQLWFTSDLNKNVITKTNSILDRNMKWKVEIIDVNVVG